MTVIRNFTIQADAQWSESFWVVRGNLPIDLTGLKLELFVRPRFDHSTLIRKLSTVVGEGGEIIIDNATKGAVSIAVTQANVAASLPVGTWDYFLRLNNGAADIEEVCRGTLTILGGRT